MCSLVFRCWKNTRCKSEVKTGEEFSHNSSRHQLALTGAQRMSAKALCALSTPAKKTASRSTTYNSRRSHLLSTFHRTCFAIFFHNESVSTPPCLKHYHHLTSVLQFSKLADPVAWNISSTNAATTCLCRVCVEIFETTDGLGTSKAVSMLATKAVWYLEVLEMLPTLLCCGPPRAIFSTPADRNPQAALGSRQSTTIWPLSTSRCWLGILESHFLLSCQIVIGKTRRELRSEKAPPPLRTHDDM